MPSRSPVTAAKSVLKLGTAVSKFWTSSRRKPTSKGHTDCVAYWRPQTARHKISMLQNVTALNLNGLSETAPETENTHQLWTRNARRRHGPGSLKTVARRCYVQWVYSSNGTMPSQPADDHTFLYLNGTAGQHSTGGFSCIRMAVSSACTEFGYILLVTRFESASPNQVQIVR
jgi:hypothetical protein